MKDGTPRRTTSVLAALVALAPLADPSPARTRPADEATVQAIVETLTLPPGELARAKRLRRVVDLGPAAAASVFDLIAGRVDTASLGIEGPFLVDGRRELLLEAVGRWSEQDVLTALQASAAAGWSFQELLIGVDLLGEVGGARALTFLGGRLAALEPEQTRSRALDRRLRPALASMLERDVSAVRALKALFETVEDPLHPVFAEALGDVGGAAGFSVLRGLMGQSTELDVCVLAAVGRMDPWDPSVPHDSRVGLVRRHANAGDTHVWRQALTTLGRLRDAESVPDMLDALRKGRPERIRRAAHWALQQTSGLRWRFDPDRWEHWFEAEEAWFVKAFGNAADQALAQDPALAFDALHQLGLHPLYRRQSSQAASAALDHEVAEVARAACGTLVLLQDPDSLPALIQALEDPRDEVRQAAHRALGQLTGEDLPASKPDWERWLSLPRAR